MVLSISFLFCFIKIRYYRSKDIKNKGNNNFKKQETCKEWLLASKGSRQEPFIITTQTLNNGRTTDKVGSSIIVFECVTQSYAEVVLYVAEEWGRLLVDRVRVSPFGGSGH